MANVTIANVLCLFQRNNILVPRNEVMGWRQWRRRHFHKTKPTIQHSATKFTLNHPIIRSDIKYTFMTHSTDYSLMPIDSVQGSKGADYPSHASEPMLILLLKL